MLKTNYHTHTTYCDGKNTAEEMVLSAIDKHFDILGFSSHSMFPFSSEWHIPGRDFGKYRAEIRELSEKYKDKIKILCGFEADYIQGITVPDKLQYLILQPDYLIGSVHYVWTKNGSFAIDGSADEVENGIDNFFSGNAKAAISEYFAIQREMLKNADFEIWGHPDVCRRRNRELALFFENDEWYKNELKATADEAKKANVIAEINTGGLARGAVKSVYPSEYFLSLLFERGIPIMINSDAHKAEFLDFAFEEAYAVAKKIGYKEVMYIDETGNVKGQEI